MPGMRHSEAAPQRKYSPCAGKALQSARALLEQALRYAMQAKLQRDTAYCHLPTQQRPVNAPSEQSNESQTSPNHVTLRFAKGLARWAQRCFAALSMTGLSFPAT